VHGSEEFVSGGYASDGCESGVCRVVGVGVVGMSVASPGCESEWCD